MKMDNFIMDIRNLLSNKNSYSDQKKDLLNRIRKGRDFFLKATESQVSAKDMLNATKLILDLSSELNDLEDKLVDIDIVIETTLEAYLTDFIMKFRASQKTNDAGDNIDITEFTFAPYKDNPNYTEITPDELWFMKIIKQAIGIRNVEVIPKDKYYNK